MYLTVLDIDQWSSNFVSSSNRQSKILMDHLLLMIAVLCQVSFTVIDVDPCYFLSSYPVLNHEYILKITLIELINL